jgi:hypothetical protein
VIHDVDATLREFLRGEAFGTGRIDVVFDAPTREWAARQSSVAVNVYLHELVEDTQRRDVAAYDVRGDDGRVTARRRPPRYFRLGYLVTTWTKRVEDAHRLLSQALLAVVRYEQIPAAYLQGDLAGSEWPLLLGTRTMHEPARAPDLWTAIGGEQHPAIELTVTAPFDPNRQWTAGPPVLEEPRISLTEDANPRRKSARGAARERRVEPLADDDSGERVFAGTSREPGRTLHVRSSPKR